MVKLKSQMHEYYIEGTQQLESHAGAYYLGNASSKCANHRGLYKPITAKYNGSKGDAYPIPFQKTQTKLSKRRDQIRNNHIVRQMKVLI